MIYHYTSIATLEAILRTRRIRFNRLDRVDDIAESQTAVGIEFGKYFFVSCWTQKAEENIPLWTMYSNGMAGVRIGLHDYPFATAPLVAPPSWGLISSGVILSPLTFAQMFTDSYFVPPMFLTPSFFAGPVDYVADVNAVYRANVRLTHSTQTELTLNNLPKLPRTKSKYWDFQFEHRFCLMILPSIPLPPRGLGSEEFSTQLAQHILESFVRGTDPGVAHFDLDVDPRVLAEMEITVGPLATDAEFQNVAALRTELGLTGSLKRSELHGTIRSPKR